MRIPGLILLVFSTMCFGAYAPRRTGNFDFPVYTNKPVGRQLGGGHAPATTAALSPEETRKKIAVPPGFEVRLFASEPEVVNPVAMTWDERGRLWVLELYEYPKGAPKGEKGRDRIKILEDSNNDGVADKVTVFADGFSLAEGFILGNGGVYLAAPPNLYFLRDTNNDGKADTRDVVLTGFGNEDRHELLNGLAWGPDGWLYMTHGVFTRSQVKDPANPSDTGVRMDAAVARYHPVTKKFEVFADGTSNPWGVDWNERGDAFVEACVIHHLFHMAPGGLYNRQGGTWPNPYSYVQDLPSKGLPAIVDWRHFRAAHSGICIYQGSQWPAQWQGLVYFGNIHENAINCDRLTAVGSTYKAERETKLLGPYQGDFKMGGGTFFASADPWVMPVSVQTGPDGAMWVMDWYDRYPCYQNAQADPDGVDRELGRIWRVVWTGSHPGAPVPSRPQTDMDLNKLRSEDLALLLESPNIWHRRQVQRLIVERNRSATSAPLTEVQRRLKERILGIFKSEAPAAARLAALWTLHSSFTHSADLSVSKEWLKPAAEDSNPVIRAWAARLVGENARIYAERAPLRIPLEKLAADPDPSVRAAVATALRQFTSSSLTVDTAPWGSFTNQWNLPGMAELVKRPSVPGDFLYDHLVWMAYEPVFAKFTGKTDGGEVLYNWLLNSPASSTTASLARKAMRRACDQTDEALRRRQLIAAFKFLERATNHTEVASAALDGLIEAQKSKGALPELDLNPIFAGLTANPALADKARRLATLMGDTTASKALIAKINDPGAKIEDRLRGVQAAAEAKDEMSRSAVLKLMTTEKREPLLLEGAKALPSFVGDEIAYQVVDAWANYSLPVRRAVSEVLVARSKWARALLAGADKKMVKPEDISATARRALARADDSTIRDHAEQLFGRYRATGDDKLKLIAEKRKVVLAGTPDLSNGREAARRTCFVCHKLYGEGADVGPDLTGVGRSSLDALLHNVIDPNEVIGAGYETTEVELKDDTTISGRVVEESDTRIKLLASGPTEHTIAKSDLKIVNGKAAIRKTELSLMPEGLEQMPDTDFRDLIWFILNPPQDNRPWTPALRQELLGEPAAGRKTADARSTSDEFRGKGVAAGDGESVALWNPEWRVNCPPFEGAPRKLVEYEGRRNVLLTHPVSRTTPATIDREVTVPRGKRTTLAFYVAADARGDWELHVRANGEELKRERVDRAGEPWKRIEVDLSRLAGKAVVLQLENAANGWSWEFGYWADIEIQTTDSSLLSAADGAPGNSKPEIRSTTQVRKQKSE